MDQHLTGGPPSTERVVRTNEFAWSGLSWTRPIKALRRAISIRRAGDADQAEFPSRRTVGRLAGLFYLGSGFAALLTLPLPQPPGTNRPAVLGVVAIALAIGLFCWLAPWERWPKRASLWVVPPALGLISFGTTYNGLSASTYSIFFVVVFAWIGIGHGQGMSLRFAPLAVAAHMAPYAATPSALRTEIAAVALTIPVSVMVGEASAWVVARLGHAEQLVRQSERRFRSLVQNVWDAILVTEPDGRIVYASPAAEGIFGSESRVVGSVIFDYLRPRDRERLEAVVGKLASGSGGSPGVEMQVEAPEGPRWLEAVVSDLLGDPSVGGLVFNIRDVTERRQAERELGRAFAKLRDADRHRQVLLSRLVSAQEEERHRIADDIHDDPLQKLVAVAMWLEVVRHGGRDDDKELAMLEDAVRVAIDRLRHLMFELRPYALDRGLAAGLHQYLKEQAKMPGSPRYHLEDELRTEPSEETRVILYRIAQEVLTNAWKHARASHVDVTLEEPERRLYRIRIRDDGQGFEVDPDLSQPGHIGLPAMSQRTEMAGGGFRIDSRLGRGTTIEFWIPEQAPKEVGVP